MTGDHINKYLLEGSSSVLFNLGRTVLPLFVFVLAYNLSRDGALENGVYIRVLKRLLIFGSIAIIPAVLLGDNISIINNGVPVWWTLNILFSLALLTWCLFCFEQAKADKAWTIIGWFSFIAGGLFVQFWWAGLGLGLAVWRYYKHEPYKVILTLSLLFLWVINQFNVYLLLAVPLIYISVNWPLKLPRAKWFFYGYYSVHLFLIYLIGVLYLPGGDLIRFDSESSMKGAIEAWNAKVKAAT